MTDKKCKSCWFQEGGRCYSGSFNRDDNGRSDKLAVDVCLDYENKREFLSKFFGNYELIITIEGKDNNTISDVKK